MAVAAVRGTITRESLEEAYAELRVFFELRGQDYYPLLFHNPQEVARTLLEAEE